MKYYLDFDRTLFDTDSYKKSSARQNLAQFLYPDVPAFLNAHDCTIITYGIEMFFRAKVASALAELTVADIIFTVRKKGHVLRTLIENKKGDYTFIDDAHFQLESVAKLCPNVTVIEMRRDKKSPDGRWSTIHSLGEV